MCVLVEAGVGDSRGKQRLTTLPLPGHHLFWNPGCKAHRPEQAQWVPEEPKPT